MRFGLFLRQRDFLVASLILLLSTGITVLAYAHVVNDQERDNLLSAAFTLGEHSSVVMSHGKCVGKLSTTLTKEEGQYGVTAQGTLLTSTHGVPQQTTIEVEGNFNLFGQLFGAIIQLTSPHTSIRIGLFEINPLQIRLKTTIDDKVTEKNFALPGPIQLRRYGTETYRLQYVPLSNVRTISAGGFFEGFAKELNLSVVAEGGNEALCDQLQPLEVSPFAESMKNRALPFIKFLPGFEFLQ